MRRLSLRLPTNTFTFLTSGFLSHEVDEEEDVEEDESEDKTNISSRISSLRDIPELVERVAAMTLTGAIFEQGYEDSK